MINHQSQPSLQQIPLGEHQSATANHRPGKQEMLSQYASAKQDKLFQHTKHRQAIPACIAKDTIKGATRAQNIRIAGSAEIAVGVRRAQ